MVKEESVGETNELPEAAHPEAAVENDLSEEEALEKVREILYAAEGADLSEENVFHNLRELRIRAAEEKKSLRTILQEELDITNEVEKVSERKRAKKVKRKKREDRGNEDEMETEASDRGGRGGG